MTWDLKKELSSKISTKGLKKVMNMVKCFATEDSFWQVCSYMHFFIGNCFISKSALDVTKT